MFLSLPSFGFKRLQRNIRDNQARSKAAPLILYYSSDDLRGYEEKYCYVG